MNEECKRFRIKLCDMLMHVDRFDGEEYCRVCHGHLDECFTCKMWFEYVYAPRIKKLKEEICKKVKKNDGNN
jgi:hypothetical protein